MDIPEISGLFAYPSEPFDIGRTIKASLSKINQLPKYKKLNSWEENDTPGRFISTEVLKKIKDGAIFIADISFINFNVIFEIGYAIACNKRVFLLRNRNLTDQKELISKIGILDTIGYEDYTNSDDLQKLILSFSDFKPLILNNTPNISQPVYLLLPQSKNDSITRLISRIKKANLNYRLFDPQEQGRLSAVDAIDNVSISYGVIIPLLTNLYGEANIHNARAAFVAGLAQGMNKHLLILQDGQNPIPIDYRDLVKSFKNLSQIDSYMEEFAPQIYKDIQSIKAPITKKESTLLADLPFGASNAENEYNDLNRYYLETDEFRRAFRGEVQIVLGRKGTGKSALFFQLRDRKKSIDNIVLDLNPESFQLLKFKKKVFNLIEYGSREHIIVAFWEYLLLLEVCNKIINIDQEIHIRNVKLLEPYKKIKEKYGNDDYISENDFSERMSKLANQITGEILKESEEKDKKMELNNKQMTELIYKHDLNSLKSDLLEYLQHKKSVWILFDNLDKGWNPMGIEETDIISLRCLIEAMNKIERSFRKKALETHCIIFIRNDVYKQLIESSVSDRGKLSPADLDSDWADKELLLEMLRKRFLSVDGIKNDSKFEDIWSKICVSLIKGEETSSYILERCLMRPRALIDFIRFCRSHALNLGHSKIETTDILKGEEQFSMSIVTDIGFEIADVYPKAKDVLLKFIEVSNELTSEDINNILETFSYDESEKEKILDLLILYGVIGIYIIGEEPRYIYNHSYDMKIIKALISKHKKSDLFFVINPAFWKGLEIRCESDKREA